MNAIPGGETVAAFPAEPTPMRVRAACAGQCRPIGRLEEVALTGARSGALELMLKLVQFEFHLALGALLLLANFRQRQLLGKCRV